MRIHYNSIIDKHPFGTLTEGEACVMHLRVPVNCGAVALELVLEDCDGEIFSLEKGVLEEIQGDYQHWSCRCAPPKGLYFYWFRIYKETDSFRLFKVGTLTNMEAGEKWQLSVIPADFTVPDYARGAVMYQILPDRFCKSGDCDTTEKLRPFTLHEQWEGEPRFGPDENGHWNNDFFGGNFRGIREKLPYLQDLGVEVLYLNPIFMAFSSHRYDTADYKRPDPLLGTEADFAELCAEAHQRGIHIILDGVFSHTGDNSIYFDAKGIFGGGAISDPDSPYRSWYRFFHYPDDYDCWWSIKTLPCVEELDEGYLRYIIDDADSVAAHWLRLGADGFRLDVADELPDAFILRLKQRIRQIKPDALLIGEVWEDASNKRAYDVSRRYFVDGELDSVMNYVWRRAILDYVKDRDDGSALAESLQTIAENYPPHVLDCVMNLLGSHDRARVLTVLGEDFEGSMEEKADRRLSEAAYKQAVEDLKFAAFLQFTLPGMPSIYYGDEVGMEGYEDPFCRRPFPWGREDKQLQDYFRRLGRLRKGSEALRYGRLTEIQGGDGCLRFLRRTETQKAELVFNRGDSPVVLDAAGDLRFGHGLELDGGERRLLPKGYCLLLRNLSKPACIE